MAAVPELVQAGPGHHQVRVAGLPWDCSVYVESEVHNGRVELVGLTFRGTALNHEIVRAVSVTRVLCLLDVEHKGGLRQTLEGAT